MGIWNLITKNFFQRAHTRRPEALVPMPGGFRTDLEHDAARCVACETCAYVCSPAAIRFDRSQPGRVTWQYQMLQCTFCGRCVQHCPTRALSFGDDPHLVVHAPEETRHEIAYQTCPRCGEPVIPLPLAVLEEKYGSPVSEETARLNQLCPACRKKVYGETIKRGFAGL